MGKHKWYGVERQSTLRYEKLDAKSTGSDMRSNQAS